MAKRSREDFEHSPPDSESARESTPSSLPLIHPATTSAPSSQPKIVHLDPEHLYTESGEAHPVTEMRCSLPPHPTICFTSFEEYDVHYAKTHVNRCVECRKNFPTEHFLNLHIEENHDALVGVRRERGEKTVTYAFHIGVHLLIYGIESTLVSWNNVTESVQLRRRGGCI
jgi:hypothetical protein